MKHYIILLLGIWVFSSTAWAQSAKYRNSKGLFGSTQGFIGLHSGINFSGPIITNSYSEFTLIDETSDILSDLKEYSSLINNLGSQIGLSAAFSFSKLITLALSPSYHTLSYQYQSQFSWVDEENTQNYLEHHYQHKQQLHYLSLPLVLRISPAGRRFRPFVQGGAYYNYLLNAQKQLVTEGTDLASGGQVSFTDSPQSTDISHLYIKSNAGLIFGGGATYNLGTIQVYIDGQYRYGLHNIVSAQERYSGSRHIYGFGNVQDDLSLNSLEVSIGCYFPLKFLTKDFKPVIL